MRREECTAEGGDGGGGLIYRWNSDPLCVCVQSGVDWFYLYLLLFSLGCLNELQSGSRGLWFNLCGYGLGMDHFPVPAALGSFIANAFHF